jgi:Na+-driven multidrug efflux pump
MIATIIQIALLVWVGVSIVLGLAVGRAFAAGQPVELMPVGRRASSPALRP